MHINEIIKKISGVIIIVDETTTYEYICTLQFYFVFFNNVIQLMNIMRTKHHRWIAILISAIWNRPKHFGCP
jgi:hypothetical protein